MPTNSEVVLAAYRLFGSAWRTAQRQGSTPHMDLTELFDPEVVLDEIADFPGASSWKGHEAVNRWFADWFDLYEEIDLNLGEFEESGDNVLVPTEQRFRSRAGVETEQDIVHVWTLRDGRVVHMMAYRDMADARAAAGLEG